MRHKPRRSIRSPVHRSSFKKPTWKRSPFCKEGFAKQPATLKPLLRGGLRPPYLTRKSQGQIIIPDRGDPAGTWMKLLIGFAPESEHHRYNSNERSNHTYKCEQYVGI